jgi:hypothetical protein
VAAGWRLGKPDLVLEMPTYTLPAGGRDVLRKFAIPIPSAGTRYVKGVEFQPGNARVVHHANMRIDSKGTSRKLDDADPEPGYEGVTPFAARFPSGYFLGWTPGQLRPLAPDTMAWRLDAGADMLLELHLMPGVQAERVQSRIGFFFTDAAPARICGHHQVGPAESDIPSGAKAGVSRDSYVLPVDVEAWSPAARALPARESKDICHASRTGRGRGSSTSRTGISTGRTSTSTLKPFVLPGGIELAMEITHDNSAGNDATRTSAEACHMGQKSSDDGRFVDSGRAASRCGSPSPQQRPLATRAGRRYRIRK